MRKNERIWSEEDVLFLKENYKKLGAKYCADKLKRTRLAVSRRAAIIGITGKNNKWKFNKEYFSDIVKNSRSIKDVLLKLDLRAAGGNYKTIHKYLDEWNLSTSHFITQDEIIRNVVDRFVRKPIEYYLVNDNKKISNSSLKERLYKEGFKKRKCELCGQGEKWRGKKISLILDHKNGNHYDYRIENLRIICPNCNSALDTHCRGHKYFEKHKHNELLKKEKLKEIYAKRRKVDRPTYNQLKKDIKEMGFVQTGKKYNVSDNTIRKWILYYEKY